MPEDLRADYEAALSEARAIAMEAAPLSGRYTPDEFAHVLSAAPSRPGLPLPRPPGPPQS